MFNKFKWLNYILITILVGMVFAVNIGWTFASTDYEALLISGTTSQAEDDTSWNYLNDIVVNNSTTEIPIPYSLGTTAREISFDYGFTDTMDIAVVYSLSYTDGTPVTNVKLNIVDREDYILDVPTVISQTGVTQYNDQTERGTMYYLKTLSGSGTKVLFSGVTFFGGNNQVSSYKAENAITIYKTSYTAGETKTANEFKYVSADVARYWTINAYSDDSVTITAEEYNSLPANEQLNYSVSQYICNQTYTIAGTTITASTVASVAEYKNYINFGDSNWTLQYVCNTACTIDETSYVLNQVITEETYNSLSSNQTNFSKQYLCNNSYNVQGALSRTIAQNGTITQEEYQTLYYLEKVNFVATTYLSFDGKKLKIDVSVYAKINVSETDESPTDYYGANHYFINFKQELVSQAFNNWLIYKSGSLTENKIMIYNAHGEFDTGFPYAYDYASNADLSSETAKADIRSSYVYNTDGTVHAYASGNRYNAGVGVYYMSSTAGAIQCSFGVNWYNSNGELISTMPINNVEYGINENLIDLGYGSYGFSKVISADSYGYIDLIDYIQTTTKADIVNLVGYRLVITSVTVEFVTDYSSWGTQPSTTAEASDIKIINFTNSNHVLYSYAGNMQTGSTLNTDLTIFNDSDNAITINSINITPKFVAYNGQTSSDYGVANIKYLTFGDATTSGTRLIYNSSTWTKSAGSSNSYNLSTNGIYLAPHTSLKVISGIYVTAQTLDDWKININSIDYYADYWFEFEVNNINYSNATTNKTETTDAELITELTSSTINAGEVSYIALRNNTSQIMTNITFTGKIVYKLNPTNTISYTLLNYATNASSTLSQTSNISVSFTGINLLPGESIILFKITAGSSSNNIGFSSYSTSCNLSGTPTYSSIYAKRDFASGNLSVINPNATKSTLSVTLKDFSNSTTISDENILNGGSQKWNYESSSFRYVEKGSSSNAYLHSGQILNLLSNYYGFDINATIST